MVYLMIYLNLSCILIWYEFIFKNKSIKKGLKNIDIDEFSNSTIMLLATFTVIIAIVVILPYYIIKGFKRLL